jgi:phage terminase small subunit
MADQEQNNDLPKLTDRQEMFVNMYFECGLNATAAAKQAGYSEKTARQQGSRLLSDVDIAAHIRARMDKEAMSANEVLHRLAMIARGDFGELVDDNGNPSIKDAKGTGRSQLIKRIKQRSVTTEQSDIAETEVEILDSLKALELLGKAHGIFTDKTDITSGGKPIKGYALVSPDDWKD